MLDVFSKCGVGSVKAFDISPIFCDALKQRCDKEKMENVSVFQCSSKALGCEKESLDIAILVDVYHHLEYPLTFNRSLLNSLKPNGKLVILDFIRDENVIKTQAPGWATAHLRADQETFKQEVLKVGFKLVAEPVIPSLVENWIMVFERDENFDFSKPGAGWS